MPQDKPMLGAKNIHYEMSSRDRAIAAGGIGAMQQLAQRLGLAKAIDARLHLLKVHLPYQESDHVLNLAYNALAGGTCIEDLELLRNNEGCLDALGAQRIPDQTTAGDFCRRFTPADVDALQVAFKEVRLKVWQRQPKEFFAQAIIDSDCTEVATGGECKEGIGVSYKGTWGFNVPTCRSRTRASPCFSSTVNRWIAWRIDWSSRPSRGAPPPAVTAASTTPASAAAAATSDERRWRRVALYGARRLLAARRGPHPAGAHRAPREATYYGVFAPAASLRDFVPPASNRLAPGALGEKALCSSYPAPEEPSPRAPRRSASPGLEAVSPGRKRAPRASTNAASRTRVAPSAIPNHQNLRAWGGAKQDLQLRIPRPAPSAPKEGGLRIIPLSVLSPVGCSLGRAAAKLLAAIGRETRRGPRSSRLPRARLHGAVAETAQRSRQALLELARHGLGESNGRGRGVWRVATRKCFCVSHLQTYERLRGRFQLSARIRIHTPPVRVPYGLFLVLAALLAFGSVADCQTLTLVSATPSNTFGTGHSPTSSLAANGAIVVFGSFANDLIPHDTNPGSDIFMRVNGQTMLVSVNSSGVQANSDSGDPWASADGRFVVFRSMATNLVPGDNNGHEDVFIRDMQSQLTTRVNVSTQGQEANGRTDYRARVSADGRYVVFASTATNLVPGDTNGMEDVFLRDMRTGLTTRVSMGVGNVEANGDSGDPDISASGRYVAFRSWASNIVPHDSNSRMDIFVADLRRGTMRRASVNAIGAESNGHSTFPSISHDGRYVTFRSNALNIVPGNVNGTYDAYIKDMKTSAVAQLNVSSQGVPGNAVDGNDCFCFAPLCTPDGRHVVFTSSDTNLVPNDTNGMRDVFVRDTFHGTTTIVSRSPSGLPGNGAASSGRVSPDGARVSFVSNSTNLLSIPSTFFSQLYNLDRNTTFGWTDYRNSDCTVPGRFPELSTSPPVLGRTATLTGIDALPNAPLLAVVSLVPAQPSMLGAGCVLHVDLASAVSLGATAADAQGEWTFPVPIPAQQSLTGARVAVQAFFPSPHVGLGFELTDGALWTVGN